MCRQVNSSLNKVCCKRRLLSSEDECWKRLLDQTVTATLFGVMDNNESLFVIFICVMEKLSSFEQLLSFPEVFSRRCGGFHEARVRLCAAHRYDEHHE